MLNQKFRHKIIKLLTVLIITFNKNNNKIHNNIIKGMNMSLLNVNKKHANKMLFFVVKCYMYSSITI